VRDIAGFPHAVDKDHLTLYLNVQVPEFKLDDYEWRYRDYYDTEAARFLDALQAHAPGGFVDAIFAELAHRKAGIFRVTR